MMVMVTMVMMVKIMLEDQSGSEEGAKLGGDNTRSYITSWWWLWFMVEILVTMKWSCDEDFDSCDLCDYAVFFKFTV